MNTSTRGNANGEHDEHPVAPLLYDQPDPVLHALETVLALTVREFAQFRGYLEAALNGAWDDE